MATFELNGFPVVQSQLHLNGYTTVLVKRADQDWVVATWWPQLGTTWMWGHYERDRKDALATYMEVTERNDKRGKAA